MFKGIAQGMAGMLRSYAEGEEEGVRRDAAQVISSQLPAPIDYVSHRNFVRETLRAELNLTAKGEDFVHGYTYSGHPVADVATGARFSQGQGLTLFHKQPADDFF